MNRISNFLYECVSFIAFVTAPRLEGNPPEFKAEQKIWRESCTQDVVLAHFDKYLQYGNSRQGPSMGKIEYNTLEKIFTDYSKSDNCWDQQSLESFFLSQIPQEGDYKMLLRDCMPSLWALTVYFAQWPFNTSFSPTTRLAFPALVRAIIFLCGRHYLEFFCLDYDDSDLNRGTDQVVLEYIFRALATTQPAEQQSMPAPLSPETAKLSSQRDILDVLNVSQPSLNRDSIMLSRAELIPIADRLSPPSPPELSDLTIPRERLISILELVIPLLHHASQFRRRVCYSCIHLAEKLDAAQTELEKHKEVSFSIFQNCFDTNQWVKTNNSVTTIYDGIALLFNTFTNPQSLRTGKTVSGVALYIGALRSLGTTISD